MTRAGVVLVLVLAACGGGGAQAVITTAPPGDAAKGPGEAGGERIHEAPESQKPNRCAKGGAFPPLLVTPRPATEPDRLPCRARDQATESSIAADLRAQFKPTMQGSTLDVSFGCDGLDQPVARLVYERGAGHGRQLEIVQISRSDPAAAAYDVIGVRASHPFPSKAKAPPFQVARATLPTDAVHAKMPFVRAALHATMRENRPKAKNFGVMGFGSSASVHVLVRLEDAAGRSVEKQYTDAIDSDGQPRYLPLLRADAELRQLVDKLPWQGEPASGEVLRLFEERFLEAMIESAEPGAWWVRGAYLELAGLAGARSLVPSILGVLGAPRPEGPGSDAWEHNQEAALSALVALTRWDPRKDERGAPRPLEAAARDFLTECGKLVSARQ
ncbi:hypothetical protein [Polyangium spumosum]|uniref:Uncharacterized protein n=1 Tax=Polyangium spumosum TaxID=889282 RepID=A0A6N7PIQ9_9BACT|nr:hypothetical protein [Polyangium spumosum]MRG91868.1 hypothetical protein [Polyangium spumosum]